MALTERELIELKDNIDETKSKITLLKGRNQEILAQIKKEFNCSSTKEAKEMLSKYEEQIEKINVQIDGLSEELESILNQNENE